MVIPIHSGDERKSYNFMMRKGWCDIITGKPDKKVSPEFIACKTLPW